MNALRPGEIRVCDYILCKLLLESNVGCVDARIGIILTEHSDPGANWKRSRRNCRRYNDAWIGWQVAARSVKEPTWKTSCCDRLLLNAICSDRADLRQHILTRVVDSPTSSQNGLAIASGVPSEAYTRLEHFLLIMNRPVGWK